MRKILIALLLVLNASIITFAQNQQDELYETALRAFDDGFYDVSIKYLEQAINEYPSNPKIAQVKFLLGQNYFLKNRFADAQNIFNTLTNTYDNKELLLFWSAETSLKLNVYPEAQRKYKELIEQYPQSAYLPQAYYSYGWSYFDTKKYKEAKELLETLVLRFPKHQLTEDATLKIAQCDYDLGNYQGALTKFIRYVSAFPQSSRKLEIYLNIADSYYYMDDFENAKNYYEKAIKNPNANMAYTAFLGKVWCFLKLRKFNEAEKTLKDAIDFSRATNISTEELLLVKANIALEKGDMQSSIEVYEDLIKSFPKSEHFLDAYLGKANVYFMLKNFDEALKSYTYVSQRSKDEEVLLKANLGIAWCYAKLDNLNQAKTYFRQVIDSTTQGDVKIKALTQMADALADSGKMEEALTIYDSVLKTFVDNPMKDYVMHRQGVVLMKIGKVQEALQVFDLLKKEHPQSHYLEDLNYYLGIAAFRNNNFKESREKIEQYIKSNNHSDSFMAEANYILAVSYLNLKLPEDALKIFQKILRLYPEDQNVARNSDVGIAKCLFQLGQIKEAVKRFKLIVYKYPNTEVEFESLLWLAQYNLKNTDYVSSLDFYQQLIQKFPNHSGMDQVNYELGQVYEIQGMYDQALERYKSISTNDAQLSFKVKLAVAGVFAKQLDIKRATEAYELIANESQEEARDAYLKIAQLYRNNQSYDQELECYQKALNIAQGKGKVTDAEIYFYLADTYELIGKFDEAVNWYLKISSQGPEQTEWVVKAYLRVARIYEDRKDFAGAKLTYQKIIQMNTEESKFAQERLDWINSTMGGKKQ